MNLFKKKVKKVEESTIPCEVRFRIKETLVFVGDVESFDINAKLDGSKAKAVITFKSGDLLKKLAASKE